MSRVWGSGRRSSGRQPLGNPRKNVAPPASCTVRVSRFGFRVLSLGFGCRFQGFEFRFVRGFEFRGSGPERPLNIQPAIWGYNPVQDERCDCTQQTRVLRGQVANHEVRKQASHPQRSSQHPSSPWLSLTLHSLPPRTSISLYLFSPSPPTGVPRS